VIRDGGLTNQIFHCFVAVLYSIEIHGMRNTYFSDGIYGMVGMETVHGNVNWTVIFFNFMMVNEISSLWRINI
jgi:hypothetical protein